MENESNVAPAANAAVADQTPPDVNLSVDEGVTLTAEQYSALLDHVATLEAKAMQSSGGSQDVRTLDNLIDEAGNPQALVQPPPNQLPLAEMTPDQVVAHIIQAVHKQYVEPLEVKVETLKLMNEIDKVASKPGNEDFWEYAPAVKAIALQNPTLTIARAYQLAKAEGKRQPSATGDPGLQKTSEVLFTLPQRPRVAGGGGEKPTGSRTGITPTGELSRRDAASAAFDAAVKGTGK
jgi:hypothetical protein